MLDVGRLQILVHVSVAGSIARTAQALGYTPSAVSQQLSKLEREIGTRLAVRTRAGVELTDAGTALVEQIKPVLAQLAAVEQTARDVARLGTGRVRLGSFSSAAQVLIPPTINRVRTQRQDVLISLVDIEPPDGYDRLRAGEIDLLISHTYPGGRSPDAQGLVQVDLLRDPLVAVVPKAWASPKTDGGRLPVTRLAEMTLICGAPADANRVALARTFARYDLELKIEFETRDYAVSLALAAAGVGATVLPRSLLRGVGPDIEVMILEPIESRRIFCLYRSSSQEPAVICFAKELRAVARELREGEISHIK